ncbi:hypothetical protein C8035_v003483 [Colletotrichum spinosum]|uniref:Uncharacterized protein n=1 Tax=Colletotrichum spinosum TaxID=1347390 RepID=A0A4R8PZU3_9PEZI|nr:hypothetical protein C8035_v003483 [Colletotrichum spinosum]
MIIELAMNGDLCQVSHGLRKAPYPDAGNSMCLSNHHCESAVHGMSSPAVISFTSLSPMALTPVAAPTRRLPNGAGILQRRRFTSARHLIGQTWSESCVKLGRWAAGASALRLRDAAFPAWNQRQTASWD